MKSNNKRTFRHVSLAVAILLVLALTVYHVSDIALNPLRKSEEYICSKIMSDIPYGSDAAGVLQAIYNNDDWEIGYITEKNGESVQNIPESEAFASDIIYIRVRLGYYYRIFRTDVVADFRFDSDSKLIDVDVVKFTDSL